MTSYSAKVNSTMLEVRTYTLFYLSAIVVTLQLNYAMGYTQQELYQLYDDLFINITPVYKPDIRPTTNGESTEVFIDVFLLSISKLDEREQQLEASIIVEAVWNDDYLSWDISKYGDIEQVIVPQERIWLPDLVIENSVERQRQLGYDDNKVTIKENGDVHWKPGVIVKSDCNIDVTYYPFDTQTCSIIISTWVSDKEEINVSPDRYTNGMILDRYSESGTWELIGNTLQDLPDVDNTTRIQFTVKLKRLRTYYVLNIIMPVIFLSLTASVVFFLPADAGEKIGMSITVLLAYAVYLTIIADNMPQTSLQVSYLSIYLTVLLGLTALGVVLAVVVLHLHHKPEEAKIGPNVKAFIRATRRALCIRRRSPKSTRRERLYLDSRLKGHNSHPRDPRIAPPTGANFPPPDNEKEKITWPKVAETMDRILFLALSLIITGVTVVFLLILTLGAE